MLLLLFCMISLVQTALAIEWSIRIEWSTINENVGVTVTQGAATGTLKIALTGDTSAIAIESAAEVTFSNDADLVIGSTTVEADYVNSADRMCLETESNGEKKVTVDCLCGITGSFNQEKCTTYKQEFCTKSNGMCHVCGPGTRTGLSFGTGMTSEGCEDCEKGVSQTFF